MGKKAYSLQQRFHSSRKKRLSSQRIIKRCAAMIIKGQHDLTGERFRNFVFVRRLDEQYWIGRCLLCSAEREIQRRAVTIGWKTRCECQKRKYGKAYNSWRGMIERCSNVNHDFYKSYGERGIKVCERWLQYDNFLSDMGECPTGMMLDRVNVNGNYEPSNCRWVTSRESGANKRNNHHVVCFGSKVVVNEATRQLGMSRNYLRATMDNCGWPEIDVGILPSVKSQGFLRNWLKGSCRIEFA